MAFRIRGKDGETLWASATLRDRGRRSATLRPRRACASRRAEPGSRRAPAPSIRSRWRCASAASAWRVEPLMDDQELDARASTGTLYWEGAVRVERPRRPRGRGYLELTGYARAAAVLMAREGVRAEVGFIAPIEGLRGVAVLLGDRSSTTRCVRIARFDDPWIAARRPRRCRLEVVVRNGYLGVDLFFLITGFLLTLPWFRHAEQGAARRPRRASSTAAACCASCPPTTCSSCCSSSSCLPLLRGLDLLEDGPRRSTSTTSPRTSSCSTTRRRSRARSLGVNGALWTLVARGAVLPAPCRCWRRSSCARRCTPRRRSSRSRSRGAGARCTTSQPLVDVEHGASARAGDAVRGDDPPPARHAAARLPRATSPLGIARGHARGCVARRACRAGRARWPGIALAAAALVGALPHARRRAASAGRAHLGADPDLALGVAMLALVARGVACRASPAREPAARSSWDA